MVPSSPIVAPVLALVATLAPATAAVAAEHRGPAARELAALPSDPAPKQRPEALEGDFSHPPPRPGEQLDAPAKPSAFDPARSRVIDSETTPTRRV